MGSPCGPGPGTWDFLAIPEPWHSQDADLEVLVHHCLLLQVGWSLDGSWASHKPQQRRATWTMNPTQVSPCVPPRKSRCCGLGGLRPAHSPQHHPGAGQAAVPVVELLDNGHGQLHKVPCRETHGGHRPWCRAHHCHSHHNQLLLRSCRGRSGTSAQPYKRPPSPFSSPRQ